ncbi:hypothetical protein GMRT_13295 [Giardia muris]|uniref:Uncharacterized protein n=1 Tax=Giardia muris TaxID=5742 RepID=A0A4Z1T160_GIAMU|nr:hypothetical protein GMRT_13295 [Giardia muris]|eukprot:TNJ26259.1 hypothetical protein GMRT_13295 [Giardia muris]
MSSIPALLVALERDQAVSRKDLVQLTIETEGLEPSSQQLELGRQLWELAQKRGEQPSEMYVLIITLFDHGLQTVDNGDWEATIRAYLHYIVVLVRGIFRLLDDYWECGDLEECARIATRLLGLQGTAMKTFRTHLETSCLFKAGDADIAYLAFLCNLTHVGTLLVNVFEGGQEKEFLDRLHAVLGLYTAEHEIDAFLELVLKALQPRPERPSLAQLRPTCMRYIMSEIKQLVDTRQGSRRIQADMCRALANHALTSALSRAPGFTKVLSIPADFYIDRGEELGPDVIATSILRLKHHIVRFRARELAEIDGPVQDLLGEALPRIAQIKVKSQVLLQGLSTPFVLLLEAGCPASAASAFLQIITFVIEEPNLTACSTDGTSYSGHSLVHLLATIFLDAFALRLKLYTQVQISSLLSKLGDRLGPFCQDQSVELSLYCLIDRLLSQAPEVVDKILDFLINNEISSPRIVMTTIRLVLQELQKAQRTEDLTTSHDLLASSSIALLRNIQGKIDDDNYIGYAYLVINLASWSDDTTMALEVTRDLFERVLHVYGSTGRGGGEELHLQTFEILVATLAISATSYGKGTLRQLDDAHQLDLLQFACQLVVIFIQTQGITQHTQNMIETTLHAVAQLIPERPLTSTAMSILQLTTTIIAGHLEKIDPSRLMTHELRGLVMASVAVIDAECRLLFGSNTGLSQGMNKRKRELLSIMILDMLTHALKLSIQLEGQYRPERRTLINAAIDSTVSEDVLTQAVGLDGEKEAMRDGNLARLLTSQGNLVLVPSQLDVDVESNVIFQTLSYVLQNTDSESMVPNHRAIIRVLTELSRYISVCCQLFGITTKCLVVSTTRGQSLNLEPPEILDFGSLKAFFTLTDRNATKLEHLDSYLMQYLTFLVYYSVVQASALGLDGFGPAGSSDTSRTFSTSRVAPLFLYVLNTLPTLPFANIVIVEVVKMVLFMHNTYGFCQIVRSGLARIAPLQVLRVYAPKASDPILVRELLDMCAECQEVDTAALSETLRLIGTHVLEDQAVTERVRDLKL